ncbi:hypothetical protein [Streptomyces sp. Da 82-17]|uniref:hypothetical protein n=1 Tax=Streptomyces sp. Da 82-17 TaxID=3377116 RepID=UPI0038D3D441
MSAILILFGSLGGIALLLLILVLVRRSSGHTEETDGLRIEQEARRQAQMDRVSCNARAIHTSTPTASGIYQQRHRRG